MSHLLYEVTIGSFDARMVPDTLPNSVGLYWSKFTSQAAGSDKNKISGFHNSTRGATLHSDVMTAVAALMDPGCLSAWRPGSGVIRVTKDMYLSEYHHTSGETTFVEYHYDTGTVRSLVVKDAAARIRTPMQTLTKRVKANCLPIFMAVLAGLYDHESTVKRDCQAVQGMITAGTHSTAACEDALFRICDAMYFGLKDKHIKLDIPMDGNLMKVKDSDIFGIAYDKKQIVAGAPEILISTGAPAAAKGSKRKSSAVTMADVMAQPWVKDYRQTYSNHWTKEEEELIPQFPDTQEIPPEVVECAEVIAHSAESKRPVVNLAWRGTSGFGKSTGVEMLACLLHIPLLRITCYSTMEQQNFLSSIMPDTTKRDPNITVTFDEIACDPEGTYERLTGTVKEGVTCDEVLRAAIQVIGAGKSTTPRYVMQESNYVKALRNGYIIEVQESSRIRDAGVLPGLNEYDRPGALIPQVDGSFVKRHPRAIVFYTDNVGYNSCNELDPSVIRRIAYVIDSVDLSKDTMIRRVMSNTGVTDKSTVTSMYEVWAKIQKHCKDNDLLAAGGCVTVEEFERWVQISALCDFDTQCLRQACIRCVVSKATTDYDEQKNIISGVMEPELSKQKLVS